MIKSMQGTGQAMPSDRTIKNKADQVIDFVTDWLGSGALKVGDKLPSERELSEQLGVSLLTVNKAMSRLEDAALLNRCAGRGTFVANLPSPDAIAVICDILHLTKPRHPSSVDIIIEGLLKGAEQSELVPHFWMGKGESHQDFLDSLGFRSAVWHGIKGVVAMAWREGLEEVLAERGIPLVIICSKHRVRNSVILDYKAMGLMAAETLLETSPEKIYLVHNEEFRHFTWNSPVPAFYEECEKQHFDTDRVIPIPVELTQEAGAQIGKRFGTQAKHIFFTDENVTAGYVSWMNEHFRPEDPWLNKHIVTQSTATLDAEIPKEFDRLSFDMDEVCKEAIALLKTLCQTGGKGSSHLRLIKPVRFRGHKTSRSMGNATLTSV
jgi:hypothetical protein